ncbi:zinc transporter family protein [Sporosarcina sp. YIM B06819]|uniref:zinc transporter family protein n=1 Tax=Sporosarcina sp. YIM B06819 TaxID=3081769 RepID=UPI00298D468E|nr:zinc transporter family protein [Sporosarcina sp. YIM B06819]
MILGGFLFISVSAGGIFAWIVSKLFQQTTQGLSLLCGGFLVGLLALDIIPTALQMYEMFGLLLGVLMGYLLFQALRQLAHPTTSQTPSLYLLTIALLLHTIPLSMTIGNALGDSTFGITITTSTILHHLPEGFALTTALLSQGKSLGGLLLVFISLSLCFSLFIWIGHYFNLTTHGQAILLGISISLLATTSLSEFIIHHRRAMAMGSFLTYILLGYVLSWVFHFVV